METEKCTAWRDTRGNEWCTQRATRRGKLRTCTSDTGTQEKREEQRQKQKQNAKAYQLIHLSLRNLCGGFWSWCCRLLLEEAPGAIKTRLKTHSRASFEVGKSKHTKLKRQQAEKAKTKEQTVHLLLHVSIWHAQRTTAQAKEIQIIRLLKTKSVRDRTLRRSQQASKDSLLDRCR